MLADNAKFKGVVKVSGRILAALPIVGGILHGYLYIEDQRRLMENIQVMVRNVDATLANEAKRQEHWLELDKDAIAKEEEGRKEIRDALATLTVEQKKQTTILGDLERGHEYIAREQTEMVYRFGLHAGRHSVIDTMRGD